MIAGRLKDTFMYNSRMREVCTFLSVSPIFTLTNIVIKMICCKILGIKKRLWPVFVCDRDMWGRPPPAPPKEGSALRKGDKDDILRPPPALPKEGSALRKMGKYTTCRGFRAFSFGAGVQSNCVKCTVCFCQIACLSPINIRYISVKT